MSLQLRAHNLLEWKRIACEELLKVYAPPGKAPLVKARANHAHSCHDPTCSYKNRTNCLDTYIKHLLDTHKVNIKKSLTVVHRNIFLPRQLIVVTTQHVVIKIGLIV